MTRFLQIGSIGTVVAALSQLASTIKLWVTTGAVISTSLAVASPAVITPSTRSLPAHITVGVTHTQYSVDPWSPRVATDRALGIINDSVDMQNQALMGWGALNPEPSPGVFAWASLDARIQMMRRAPKSALSITLCGAPDWMKGGEAGTTKWADLEKAPTPENYKHFADLAAQVARRYPDVEYFFVWNELKGFYNPKTNNWNIAAYTEMYNLVYRALKSVRPSIKVGGPYVPMDSWSSRSAMSHPSDLSGSWGTVDGRSLSAIQYWLRNSAGADFIAVDGTLATKDKGSGSINDQSIEKFVEITRWIKRQTTLPVWWAELYAGTTDASLPAESPKRAQMFIRAILALEASGVRGILLWQPEASASTKAVALWTSTASASGGKPLPLVQPLQWLRQRYAAGFHPNGGMYGTSLVVSDAKSTMTLSDSGLCWIK